MEGGANPSGRVAQAIQFKVLGHAFPVLRHDAIKPISNAKLATAMMAQKAARPGAAQDERARELLADVDGLLDEGVEAFRRLDAWLRDDAEQVPLAQALGESSRLVFTRLLLSGKRIRLAHQPEPLQVARFPARYVLLAWLLHAVDAMPPGGELVLASPRTGLIQGTTGPRDGSANGDARSPAADGVLWSEVEDLARFHGWAVERQDQGWIAQAPGATAA